MDVKSGSLGVPPPTSSFPRALWKLHFAGRVWFPQLQATPGCMWPGGPESCWWLECFWKPALLSPPSWTRSAPWSDNEWVPVRALCSSPTWAPPANSPASCLPAVSAATPAQGFTGRLGAVCSGVSSLGREQGGFSGPCHGKPEADRELSACTWQQS